MTVLGLSDTWQNVHHAEHVLLLLQPSNAVKTWLCSGINVY